MARSGTSSEAAVSYLIVSFAKTSLFWLDFAYSVKDRSFAVCILCIFPYACYSPPRHGWPYHKVKTAGEWSADGDMEKRILHSSLLPACRLAPSLPVAGALWMLPNPIQRQAGYFELLAEFTQFVWFCMSGSVLALSLPPEDPGGQWSLISCWWVVLTRGSSISDQQSWTPLGMAVWDPGGGTRGVIGTCSQSQHKSPLGDGC